MSCEYKTRAWPAGTIASSLISESANYTSKPIDVEIRRTYPGHVVFRSALEPKLFDFQTAQFQSRVGAGEKKDLLYELVQHKGYNDKHQGMSLETAQIKP